MGRELKRVPLDFDWPLHKVWEGFLNPHYVKCSACGGNGETVAARQFDALVRLVMLAGADAISSPRNGHVRFHPYFNQTPLGGETPDPALAEVTTGLAGREPSAFGHDACDSWAARKKILTAAGLAEDWGTCAACGGEGVDPACREAYEAWKETDPPAGDGYQVWETVSEGSPISPVCATAEGMVAWLVGQGYAQAAALAFVSDGWAPSMVMAGGKIYKDIDALSILPAQTEGE